MGTCYYSPCPCDPAYLCPVGGGYAVGAPMYHTAVVDPVIGVGEGPMIIETGYPSVYDGYGGGTVVEEEIHY